MLKLVMLIVRIVNTYSEVFWVWYRFLFVFCMSLFSFYEDLEGRVYFCF